MLGLEQLGVPVHVAAVVVPAAVYFLLLGLLNSQRTPQLLRARTDFVLLILSFAPIFCVPVLAYIGASGWTIPLVIGGTFAAAAWLAPRRGNWVIYNIVLPEALRAAERALKAMDEPFIRTGRRLVLTGKDMTLRFSSLPLLRNVAIAADGAGAADAWRRFEEAFAAQLSHQRAEATPMAATFLLISTMMLVTPLALLANRMPEMVRILTDLIK